MKIIITLMSHSKRKRRRKLLENNQEVQKKTKSNIPDLSKHRQWNIIGYNDITKTYLMGSEDDKDAAIITCLSCKTKLSVGEIYTGYKNLERKEFVVVTPESLPLEENEADSISY